MSRRFYFLSFAVAFILVTISARLAAAAPPEGANLQRELNLLVETIGDELGEEIPGEFKIKQLIYLQAAQEEVLVTKKMKWNGIPVHLQVFQGTTEAMKDILKLCSRKRSLVVSRDLESLKKLHQMQSEMNAPKGLFDKKAPKHLCLFALIEGEEYPHFRLRSFAFLNQVDVNELLIKGSHTALTLAEDLVGGGAKMIFFVNVMPEGSENLPTTADHKTIVDFMMTRQLLVGTAGFHTTEALMQYLKKKKEENHRWDKEIVVIANTMAVATEVKDEGFLSICDDDPKGFSVATMKGVDLTLQAARRRSNPEIIPPPLVAAETDAATAATVESATVESATVKEEAKPEEGHPLSLKKAVAAGVKKPLPPLPAGARPRPPVPAKPHLAKHPSPSHHQPEHSPSVAAETDAATTATVESATVKEAEPEKGPTLSDLKLAAAMKNARPGMALTMKTMTSPESSSSDAVLQDTGAKGVASPNIPKPSTSVAAQPEKGQTKKVTVPTTKVIKQRPPVGEKTQKGKPPPVSQEALKKTSPQATDDEDFTFDDFWGKPNDGKVQPNLPLGKRLLGSALKKTSPQATNADSTMDDVWKKLDDVKVLHNLHQGMPMKPRLMKNLKNNPSQATNTDLKLRDAGKELNDVNDQLDLGTPEGHPLSHKKVPPPVPAKPKHPSVAAKAGKTHLRPPGAVQLLPPVAFKGRTAVA